MSGEIFNCEFDSPESRELDLLLATLDINTRTWREQLGAVPEDTIVWQPAPNMHSIGALILHIANVEGFWLYQAVSGQPRSLEETERLLMVETQSYNGHWPTPPLRLLAWYYAQHDAVRQRTRQTLRPRGFLDYVVRRDNQEYALRGLLHHVITHEAYHGGQAVLLSLLKAKTS